MVRRLILQTLNLENYHNHMTGWLHSSKGGNLFSDSSSSVGTKCLSGGKIIAPIKVTCFLTPDIFVTVGKNFLPILEDVALVVKIC